MCVPPRTDLLRCPGPNLPQRSPSQLGVLTEHGPSNFPALVHASCCSLAGGGRQAIAAATTRRAERARACTECVCLAAIPGLPRTGCHQRPVWAGACREWAGIGHRAARVQPLGSVQEAGPLGWLGWADGLEVVWRPPWPKAPHRCPAVAAQDQPAKGPGQASRRVGRAGLPLWRAAARTPSAPLSIGRCGPTPDLPVS